MKDVSPTRRRRFFSKVNGSYVINASVRQFCVFARQDVTKDPPFSKLDLLSCRNLLIYLEPNLQKRVLASFHYALKDTGMLLLGKFESLSSYADLFTVFDRKYKFFTKNISARVPVELIEPSHEIPAPQGNVSSQGLRRFDLEKEADRIVWERYAHAGIVVNNELQILHFRGDTSPYLQPTPGRATLNLLRMVRAELQLELRAAVQEARTSRRSVRRESIPLEHDRQERAVNLEVRPLPVFGQKEKCFLILFEDVGSHRPRPAKPAPGKREGKAVRHQDRIRLERELSRTGEYLQAVIRDQETTNEELKTANEEALSSMEELQSTNEELETAKAELQSSNEELVTLNDQLVVRNKELSNLSGDLSNLLKLVEIPILILDTDLRVRRFTPPAHNLLGMLSSDIGRHIAKLSVGLKVIDLEELISSVIADGYQVEREVQSEDGHWYSLRIRPYRAAGQKIEGALIAFVDISELKRRQEALQKERNLISAILDAAQDLLVMVLDREGRIAEFNRKCQVLTGYSADEVRGRTPWEFLVPPEEVAAIKETFQEVIRGTPTQTASHWIAKDGRWLLIGWSNSGVTISGEVDSIIVSGTDRTEQAEDRRRARASESTIRALLETAAQAILAINEQGQIMFVNGTTDRLFGYGHEELIGQSIEKLVPERFRARHSGHVAKWFAQPQNRQMGAQTEIYGLRKDGTEFPADIGLSYIDSADDVMGVAFVSDVAERKRDEKVLLDYQERLQNLTANLLSVQEADNKALARELHDVYSQELAALGMEIANLRHSRGVAGRMTERLAGLGRKIGRLAEQMHDASRRLHPQILHDLGFEAALREECDKFSQIAGIPVQFTCEELPSSMPDEVSLCLYRIAQESLLNIRKHSGASDVRVMLHGEGGGVRLRVEDTGDGFDVEEARKSGGLGLTSMEERVRLVNGEFKIHSEPEIGTSVEVFVPVDKVDKNIS